ncbi:50S ribosomal protein L23 [Leucobacter sp. W1153]|uniref:50S ribosomal protein L23 n=1 Tax=unclassified Leucobacter TaxID=2621730 RepID=UPI003F2D5851
MSLNKSQHDVIIRPIVSEKSYGMIDANGQYTFEVQPTANKTEIKLAIEQVFNVKVDKINTLNRKGKTRRTKFGAGKRKDTKRAIVTLKSGTIDIFTAAL